MSNVHFFSLVCKTRLITRSEICKYIFLEKKVNKWPEQKRLGYVCNPRSLKEGTETSRQRTDELGSRLERPIHFECKLNEPMHIGM